MVSLDQSYYRNIQAATYVIENISECSYLCSGLLLVGCKAEVASSTTSAFSSTTYLHEASCEVDNFPSSLSKRKQDI